MELPIENITIEYILSKFRVEPKKVTAFVDTSHGDGDIRWNFIFEHSYVLKINTPDSMYEERLQENSRLIERYRSIELYCPAYIPTTAGPLSFVWEYEGKNYTCFVEEYAIYPVFDWEMPPDRKVVAEHLGLLAARYTNVDLSEIRSMWSIIDLAPLDVDVDEKQENCDMLVSALQKKRF